MDKIDKKIITLLQQNARMPLKALAENVFLSSPAVSARIERLEKEEIIEGYEVKINQLKLGYHITAFINLEVAPVQKPDFYPFIKSCPNVVECNCVTGNYSMLLKVMLIHLSASFRSSEEQVHRLCSQHLLLQEVLMLIRRCLQIIKFIKSS